MLGQVAARLVTESVGLRFLKVMNGRKANGLKA
jgi:hypothetical protein